MSLIQMTRAPSNIGRVAEFHHCLSAVEDPRVYLRDEH